MTEAIYQLPDGGPRVVLRTHPEWPVRLSHRRLGPRVWQTATMCDRRRPDWVIGGGWVDHSTTAALVTFFNRDVSPDVTGDAFILYALEVRYPVPADALADPEWHAEVVCQDKEQTTVQWEYGSVRQRHEWKEILAIPSSTEFPHVGQRHD